MKGRLGFPVRRCAPPGAVENLGQTAGFGSPLISSVLVAWDAPLNSTVTGYRAQAAFAGIGPFVPLPGYDVTRAVNERYISFSSCDSLRIRVAAENGCGLGPWTEIGTFTYTGESTATTTHPVTTQLALPCPGRSIKVWAIGPGGVAETGGGGGAIVYKTWTYNDWRVNGENQPFSCVIRNTAGTAGPALASVTLGTETITAGGGSGRIGGNYSGGDGGRNGGDGLFSGYGVPFDDFPNFSGTSYYGGAAGGQGDEDLTRAASPCRRLPLNQTYFGDLYDALQTTDILPRSETCGAVGAVGSGGVKLVGTGMVEIDGFGFPADSQYKPGYGGGAFGNIEFNTPSPGGPGLVVVKYF